jgi:hypothetical protein
LSVCLLYLVVIVLSVRYLRLLIITLVFLNCWLEISLLGHANILFYLKTTTNVSLFFLTSFSSKHFPSGECPNFNQSLILCPGLCCSVIIIIVFLTTVVCLPFVSCGHCIICPLFTASDYHFGIFKLLSKVVTATIVEIISSA